MKIAIHKSKLGFHPRWVKYCQENDISYGQVDCYDTNIIEILKEYDVLMWHFSQGNPRDILIAKQILFSLEHSGFKVFPNFHTAWHFDDKVAQKYLFESLGLPLVKSYVFLDKTEALNWVNKTSFPKVFKLRGGAGSSNVRLAKNSDQAKKLINQAFTNGFSNYDKLSNIKERWRKWKLGKTNFWDVCKGFLRFFNPPLYSKVSGREIGYIYFQDFMPKNDFDIRIIVIQQKAFAIKRMVRENDFRASGSGIFKFDKAEFDERCLKIAFESANLLKSDCAAFDFIFDSNNTPLIVEVSYGFVADGYDSCPGFWDSDLVWHEGKFNPQGWMIEAVLDSHI